MQPLSEQNQNKFNFGRSCQITQWIKSKKPYEIIVVLHPKGLCPQKCPPTIIWKSGKMGKVWETFREMGESSISYSKFHFSSFHFFCKNLQLSCLMFLIAKEMPLLFIRVYLFFFLVEVFSASLPNFKRKYDFCALLKLLAENIQSLSWAQLTYEKLKL